MLNIINKQIDFEQIIRTAEYAATKGIKRLKLYFLFGFEEESDDDLRDIYKLILKIKKTSSIRCAPFNIIVSFNPLIPKPRTPFANRTMLTKNILEKKQKFLRNLLIQTGVRCEFMSANEAIKQYNIAHKTLEFTEIVI